MRLVRLHTQNFRQHADSTVQFPARGVIGIVGPNEGGKSTVLEAIVYALFGTAATRGSKGSIRWNRATERRQAAVVLEFEIGGRTYMVTRTENDASVLDLTGGAAIPLAKGTAPVNDFIPTLLGMTLDEFTATFLCSQKDLARITSMKGTERRQFFLKVMGVGRVDEAITACRANKNAIARETEGMAAGIGSREPLVEEMDEANREYARVQAQIEELPPFHEIESSVGAARLCVAASDEKRSLVEERERRLGILGERLDGEVRQVETIQKAILQAREAEHRAREGHAVIEQLALRRAYRDELKEAKLVERERTTVSQSIAQLEEHIERSRQGIAVRQRLIDAYDSAAHDAAVLSYRELDEKHGEIRDRRLRSHEAALNSIEAKDVELRRAERRLTAIREAGPNGACPTCAQPLNESFGKVVDQLKADVTNLKAEITRLLRQRDDTKEPSDEERSILADLILAERKVEHFHDAQQQAQRAVAFIENENARIAEFDQQLGGLRDRLAAVPATKFDADELAFVEAEIEDLDEKAKANERDRAAAEKIPAFQADLDTLRKNIEAIGVCRQELQREIEEIGWNKGAHAELVRAEGDLRAKMEAQREIRLSLVSQRNAAVQRAERAKKALTEYDERAQQLEERRKDLRIHELAAERLVQFRADLVSGIRPEMEELVSGFVSILTDGRHESASLTDDFDLVLQESGVDVEVVSGGTEDVASIAMRLAVSVMIAQRAGQPLSLLMLDETFAALDETRRANALNLIKRLRETFEQVLLISHVPEVRESVDHVIEVTFNEVEGRSYVHQAALASTALEPEEVAA